MRLLLLLSFGVTANAAEPPAESLPPSAGLARGVAKETPRMPVRNQAAQRR